MEIVRLLLVFVHLLGMATLVAAFLVQRRTAPDGPLAGVWLAGAAVQLVSGVAGRAGTADRRGVRRHQETPSNCWCCWCCW